jgi:hypothetical protein
MLLAPERAATLVERAVRGDDPMKITRAAGHKDMATTMLHVRDAEQIGDGFGEPFPESPAGIFARIFASDPGSEPQVPAMIAESWRSQRELNPRYRRERPAS